MRCSLPPLLDISTKNYSAEGAFTAVSIHTPGMCGSIVGVGPLSSINVSYPVRITIATFHVDGVRAFIHVGGGVRLQFCSAIFAKTYRGKTQNRLCGPFT